MLKSTNTIKATILRDLITTLSSSTDSDINLNRLTPEQDDSLNELAIAIKEHGIDESSEGQQGQQDQGSPKPGMTLKYKINTNLQHLLSLMAMNRLSPKQSKELTEELTKNPDLLKTVVKSAQSGMTGATTLLQHAKETLTSSKLNHIKQVAPDASSFIESKAPTPFSTKPKPYKD